MTQVFRCWCGNTDLVSFSPAYLRCPVCETLVAIKLPPPNISVIADDEQDFYGREYWFSHQRGDLGLPDIYQRARADLPERCLYWLRTLLSYKLPPANILELGSSHGGFVALLRWAGFEAVGVELSPWIVEYAQQTFGVPMLLGTVEEQQIAPASLDVIVLMDVLEHLPDPLGTMRHCLSLLKPDGIIILQTPQYPAGKTFAELIDAASRFPEMMIPDEHIYLFSQQSAEQLFARLGADQIVFEPALFAHYDMFLAVSRQPLQTHSSDAIEQVLRGRPSQRLVQALLDADQGYQQITARLAEAEVDRAARQSNVQTLERQLSVSEADRAARLRVIEQQSQNLIALATERDDLNTQMADLAQRFNAQATVLAERQQQFDELRTERTTLYAEVAQLRSQWATLQPALLALQTSRIYRIVRALGRWEWFDQILKRVLLPELPSRGRMQIQPAATATPTERQLRRIAVDLTPVLPGGENGGAKLMTIELVKHLSSIAPECELILLTAERSHAELAALDAPNVRRICVQRDSTAAAGLAGRKAQLRSKLRNGLARVLPSRVFAQLKRAYRRSLSPARPANPLKDLDVDLIFCPFTAPLYFDPTVPTVAVVYDLQHFYYPQFFSADERSARTRHFSELCRVATRLVCISEFVRGTVLENADIDSTRVKVAHIQLPHRLTAPSNDTATSILKRFGVEQNQFLLYPANFWRHKNHAMLLTAFGMYCARYPESQLKLICTGAPSAGMAELQRAAGKMALNDRVIFPGYVADHDLAALLQSCYAVIYPSLYEGFGMPLIEAMAFGKPVLCGNVTSLTEIAGDATLFFDPRKPEEIIGAIERIVREPDLAAQLVQKGYQRLAAFNDPSEMARQYLQVFHEAIGDAAHFADGLHGVYPDGWVSESAIVTFGASSEQRQLEITLSAPDWMPHDRLFTRIAHNGNAGAESHMIEPGKTATIIHALPQHSGYLEIQIDPIFQPKALGLNDDERGLGCVCEACRIVSAETVVDLLDRRN